MQVKTRNILLWYVGGVLLTPLIFLAASKSLLWHIEFYIYEEISIPRVFAIVLVFDVIWIILMILWPLKKIHVKIVLTLFVLALSAVVLIDLLAIDALNTH
ncbi:MAG: hypothetical protein ACYS67_11600 [Planctomycetota bacterium]|jgi:hypothetical protein